MSAYISTYSDEAMTEPEIMEKLVGDDSPIALNPNKYQVKRVGRDADDHYWFYGKIHGLENIAYLSD